MHARGRGISSLNHLTTVEDGGWPPCVHAPPSSSIAAARMRHKRPDASPTMEHNNHRDRMHHLYLVLPAQGARLDPLNRAVSTRNHTLWLQFSQAERSLPWQRHLTTRFLQPLRWRSLKSEIGPKTTGPRFSASSNTSQAGNCTSSL